MNEDPNSNDSLTFIKQSLINNSNRPSQDLDKIADYRKEPKTQMPLANSSTLSLRDKLRVAKEEQERKERIQRSVRAILDEYDDAEDRQLILDEVLKNFGDERVQFGYELVKDLDIEELKEMRENPEPKKLAAKLTKAYLKNEYGDQAALFGEDFIENDGLKQVVEFGEMHLNDQFDTMKHAAREGQVQNYQELKDKVLKEITERMIKSYIIDLIMLIPLIVLVLVFYNDSDNCGIPESQWLLVYFFSLLIFSTTKLCTIIVLRHCYRSTFTYLKVIVAIHYSFITAWWLYGQVIFYSAANACRYSTFSEVLNVLMVFTIVAGYIIAFVVLSILMFMLAFWFMYQKIRDVIKEMQEFDFKALFKELFGDKEAFLGVIVFLFLEFQDHFCIICKQDFGQKDELVTKLVCDHTFHSICLVGEDKCPKCKGPLEIKLATE